MFLCDIRSLEGYCAFNAYKNRFLCVCVCVNISVCIYVCVLCCVYICETIVVVCCVVTHSHTRTPHTTRTHHTHITHHTPHQHHTGVGLTQAFAVIFAPVWIDQFAPPQVCVCVCNVCVMLVVKVCIYTCVCVCVCVSIVHNDVDVAHTTSSTIRYHVWLLCRHTRFRRW